MIANKTSNQSTNNPIFTQSHKLDNIYEDSLIATIPLFLTDLTTQSFTKKLGEEDFTQEFVSTLNRYLIAEELPIMALSDFKDIYTVGGNPQKRVDFAFISSVQGTSKKSLYAVEAKRLPTGIGARKVEYVIGYFDSGSPSGGIQRFKTEDHGKGLPNCALLGYIENDDFNHWYSVINGWVTDKTKELPNEWSEEELLKDLSESSGKDYSTSRSIGKRNSDIIKLFHLWIKIPPFSVN